MSTTANNNVSRGVIGQNFLQHAHVPCDNANFPINQGDLVYWDSSAKIVKVLASNSNSGNLLGVALGSSKINSNVDNATSLQEQGLNVGYGVICKMKTTASDALVDGQAVVIGADAQTVSAATGTAVGIVRLPRGVTSVTGGTGVLVPVLVYSNAWVKFQG